MQKPIRKFVVVSSIAGKTFVNRFRILNYNLVKDLCKIDPKDFHGATSTTSSTVNKGLKFCESESESTFARHYYLIYIETLLLHHVLLLLIFRAEMGWRVRSSDHDEEWNYRTFAIGCSLYYTSFIYGNLFHASSTPPSARRLL